MTKLSGGDVRIDQAEFSLFRGIRLSDVRVVLPVGSGFDTESGKDADREIFNVNELRLLPNLPRTLLGQPTITEIVATGPIFHLVRRVRDGRYNWEELLATRLERKDEQDINLPTVRLRDAVVELRKLTGTDLTELDTIHLNVLAHEDPEHAERYTVQWQQRGEHARRGTLDISLDPPGFDAGSDGLPTLNVKAVLAAMPGNVEAFSEWVKMLDLQGQFGVEAMNFNASDADRAVVQLDGVSLSIPLDREDQLRDPAERLLRLERIRGTGEWTPEQVRVDLNGMLNGRPCRLAGVIRVPRGRKVTWEEAGFDLRLEVEGFQLPPLTTDPEDRWSALVRRFEGIQYLYERYDPHGAFDISLELDREVLTGAKVRVEHCTVRALGADARYAAFPTRITDLHGELVYAAEGNVTWDLKGRYRDGTVRVKGRSVRISPTAGVDLDIVGRNIPLDDPLYAALQPKFQKIWKRFSPNGAVDIDIRMHRQDRLSEPSAPFDTSVDMEFLGVSAKLDSMPYPLDEIRGRVSVHKGETVVHALEGRRGKTHMAFSGTAAPDDAGQTRLNLDMTVRDLELDDVLLATLPEIARLTIRKYGLTGTTDLSGRVFTSPETNQVVFDVTGELRNGRAQHVELPLPVENVRGKYRARPHCVDLLGWQGNHEEAELRVTGTVWLEREPEAAGVPWEVSCDPVELTDELRAALPEKLVEVWKEIGASGRVRVDVLYDQTPAVEAKKYVATITARGNTIRPVRFPWSLEDVTGQIVVTPDRVIFRDLFGRHGATEAELQGEYDRVARTALLSLYARNVTLDEELRSAVPWRIRRTWNNMNPSGSLHLNLDRLELGCDGEGKPQWSAEGSADVIGVDLQPGADIQDVTGRISGSASSDPAQGWRSDAQLDLERATLNRHPMRNVVGVLTKSCGPDELTLTEVSAEAHRGRAMGNVEIDLGPEGGYRLSILAQDMALEPFLKAVAGSDQVPDSVYGKVHGTLYYASEFDHPERGKGGGDIRLTGGELFRTPLMLDILRVLDPIPALDNDQDAEIRFYLSRDRLQMPSIVIRDRNLAMTGTGSVNLPARHINVTLLVGDPPQASSPLTVIPEFLQGAMQELVEIRVVGQLSHPRIEARPLRAFDQTLRALTNSN